MSFSNMVVDVARGDDFCVRFPRQFQQSGVARGIAESQVLLKLDIVVILPEPVEVLFYQAFCPGKARFHYQLRQFAAGTAGEGNKAGGVLRQESGREGGVVTLAGGMGGGDKAEEVAVALGVFRQKGKGKTALKCYL